MFAFRFLAFWFFWFARSFFALARRCCRMHVETGKRRDCIRSFIRSYTNEQHFNERCTLSKAKHFINAYKIFVGPMKEKVCKRDRDRERTSMEKRPLQKLMRQMDLCLGFSCLKNNSSFKFSHKQQTLHGTFLLLARDSTFLWHSLSACCLCALRAISKHAIAVPK